MPLGPVEKVGVERSVASSFHVTVPTGTKHKKLHELPSRVTLYCTPNLATQDRTHSNQVLHARDLVQVAAWGEAINIEY